MNKEELLKAYEDTFNEKGQDVFSHQAELT